MSNTKFALEFVGTHGAEYFPRYKHYHATREAAEAEARRVRDLLEEMHFGVWGHTTTASHTPQIYAPGAEEATTIPWP